MKRACRIVWVGFSCLLFVTSAFAGKWSVAPAELNHQRIKNPGQIKTIPPDLKVVQATMSPKHPKAGRNVTFSARIYNAGFQTSAPSKAKIRVGGETYGTLYTIPPLARGESHAITRTAALSKVQNYLTTFIADAENDVQEGKEDNNVAKLPFHVRNEEISARFTDVHFDPNIGPNGQWWVTVENTGTETIGLHIEASYPDAGGMFYDLTALDSEETHTTNPPQSWFSAKPVQQVRFRLVRRLGPNHYTDLLDEKLLTVTP